MIGRAWLKGGVLLLAIAFGLGTATAVLADHVTPGEAGQTKVNIYDNTDNGWNVTTDDPVTEGPDPVIGFVNFRPTVPGDPDHVIVVVSLKDGAPNCDYTVQLVTVGADVNAGLPPDGFHSGFINNIGTISTNGQGKGNTGAILVDVTTLGAVAASGSFTYAHVDIEDTAADPNGIDCEEADGTPVANNEYGASGRQPASILDLPVNMHWLQP